MFRVLKKSKKNLGRKGLIKVGKRIIKTPFFMPDATRGYLKLLSKDDLRKIKMGPMVVNTYHLYLQPGIQIIKKIGGIHKFMNWDKPLLSDSGGYQVFSLIHKNPNMGKIDDKGVVFRSPIDGSLHNITPEKSIQIQFDLGVDMMVCFDDPPPNDSSYEKIKKAVERTIVWAKRCRLEYDKQIKKRKTKEEDRPLIFGVIQGGEYLDLRKYCAEELLKIGFDGYGFGARHIDKNGKFLGKILKKTAEYIPKDKLRFALGIGNPLDIVKSFSYGWDMFDCVIPTREARHGRIYLRVKKDLKGKFYKIININNKKYKKNFSSIDKNCNCELCVNYNLAYLYHLFKMKEGLGQRLISIHNLKFYNNLIKDLRDEV